MGEMADYYVERMIYAQPRIKRERKKIFCKTCGDEIIWQNIKGKYVPYDSELNNVHICIPEELRGKNENRNRK